MVVKEVFSTQVGLRIEDHSAPPSIADSETITAAVNIIGDFNGGVRLRCSRALIRRAAAIMFDRAPERLTGDDERDVAGELTNIVAGNIKALMPGENSLSLPTIIEGSDYRVSTVDVKRCDDFGFALDGASMVVTVVECGSD
jgi:CheY-specific phosphatase CheX